MIKHLKTFVSYLYLITCLLLHRKSSNIRCFCIKRILRWNLYLSIVLSVGALIPSIDLLVMKQLSLIFNVDTAFLKNLRSSHWEVFLKTGVHFSQVIFILMWTLVLYWNRSISQEVNNLDNVYFYLKEQVSSSRIWGRLDIIFSVSKISRKSLFLQLLII